MIKAFRGLIAWVFAIVFAILIFGVADITVRLHNIWLDNNSATALNTVELVVDSA
jgi:hypothetical protein